MVQSRRHSCRWVHMTKESRNYINTDDVHSIMNLEKVRSGEDDLQTGNILGIKWRGFKTTVPGVLRRVIVLPFAFDFHTVLPDISSIQNGQTFLLSLSTPVCSGSLSRQGFLQNLLQLLNWCWFDFLHLGLQFCLRWLQGSILLGSNLGVVQGPHQTLVHGKHMGDSGLVVTSALRGLCLCWEAPREVFSQQGQLLVTLCWE